MIGSVVSRYRIVAKLGGGGMGVVYEAEDAELGRRVALKFLPEALASSPSALERFQREARTASALNHPHICTIHDVGRHDGRPYLVMERIEGKTLRELLDAGPLPVARVVALGEQIADALDAAHRASVIHRDLKPSNVIVTPRGEAKVLDFGLAKIVEPESAPDESTSAHGGGPWVDPHRTTEGAVLGTVQYMSPEQARGEPLDARSDLFSLGVLLYEMATGRLPFRGASTAEQFRALLADTPEPPSARSPELPSRLERLILKCLEKSPERRFATASEVWSELDDLALGMAAGDRGSEVSEAPTGATTSAGARRASGRRTAALVAIAAVATTLGLLAWRSRPAPALPEASRNEGPMRIAVLPFESLDGGAADGSFAEGMAEEVRSKLAALSGLEVIARASSNRYRGGELSLPEIAKQLDVRFLLTGTVRVQRGNGVERVRISPELVEVRQGRAPVGRWRQSFDGELSDVFALQASIAGEVARALELELAAGAVARLESRPTGNLAAYDAFLAGRAIYDRSADATTQREAAAQFERAVALDPQFALAWAYLGVSRSLAYFNGASSREAAAAARIASERALELAPDAPAGYWAVGLHHRLVEFDSARSLAVLERGLAIAPSDVDLLRNVGWAQFEQGRFDDAVRNQRRAVELDPRSWFARASLSESLLRLHRSTEAEAEAAAGLAIDPGNLGLLVRRAMSRLQRGDVEGARVAVDAAPATADPTALVASLAWREGYAWILDGPRRDLLLRLSPSAFDDDPAIWASAMAVERWLRGERDVARELARQASASFEQQIGEVASDPVRWAGLASMLGMLGDAAGAERAAARALELAPVDRAVGLATLALHHQALARVRSGNLAGAIETLERLLALPHYFTPAWLAVDPNFEPLRGEPRFRALVEGGAARRT